MGMYRTLQEQVSILQYSGSETPLTSIILLPSPICLIQIITPNPTQIINALCMTGLTFVGAFPGLVGSVRASVCSRPRKH